MAAVIMANAIGGVQRIIGYTFNDTSIVWEAMQAAGSGVRLVGNRRIPDGNKRLAVLGDTILKLAIIEEWYNGGEARGNEFESRSSAEKVTEMCFRNSKPTGLYHRIQR